MNDLILLGHVAEGLNRGERFYVPKKHTAISGMTEYGKTTAMETLFSNMNPEVKCLVFLTKRGEKRFRMSTVNVLPPFFKPRYDWRYVRTLLESTMHEKLRFETPWIYRVCKLAKVEVRNRHVGEEEGIFIVRELLGRMESDPKAKDFDKNINTTLIAYMDEFLPILKSNQQSFSKTLTLKPGLNIMDLTSFYNNDAVQMVVIRACMEDILDHGNDTVTGIPEAWRMLPQGRNTPVKLLFEQYIREGATNKNYLYIDVQDLGGVDKTHLRQCDVWVMGHMKQADEVKRLLKQTVGAKFKPEDIQTLPLGHFLVAAEDKVTKVYVWPHGISEEMSIKVAKGELSPEVVKEMLDKQQMVIPSFVKPELPKNFKPMEYLPGPEVESATGPPNPVPIGVVPWDYLDRRVQALSLRLSNFEKMIGDVNIRLTDLGNQMLQVANLQIVPGESSALKVVKKKVKLIVETLNYKMSTADVAGKIMFLAKEGFLDAWRSGADIEKQLIDAHGWTCIRITVYKALENLVEQGFLGKRKTDRAAYKIADFVTFEE